MKTFATQIRWLAGKSTFRAGTVAKDGRREFFSPFGNWRQTQLEAEADAEAFHRATAEPGVPFKLDKMKLREMN